MHCCSRRVTFSQTTKQEKVQISFSPIYLQREMKLNVQLHLPFASPSSTQTTNPGLKLRRKQMGESTLLTSQNEPPAQMQPQITTTNSNTNATPTPRTFHNLVYSNWERFSFWSTTFILATKVRMIHFT
jgi:hypothetical protein